MYARITGFLLAFALAVTGLATAQERFGALTGKVTDQQGAVVPGVTVTTVNTQTGESRVFVTGADGMFRAPDLVPGRYTVRFELSGFSTVERADVLVLLGREFELDTQLRVGAQTETVQVVGEATPLVDTRSTLIAPQRDAPRSSTACRRAAPSSRSRSARRRSTRAKSKAASR